MIDAIIIDDEPHGYPISNTFRIFVCSLGFLHTYHGEHEGHRVVKKAK